VPGLKIHEPITVKGHFASDSSKFTMQVDVPQAGVGSQGVTNLVISANTTEDHLMLNAAAAQIHISDSSSIPSPSINANIAEDDMQFGLRLASDEADTRLRLNGRFQVKKDTFKISFLPSEFFLKKQEWTLTENSEVVYAPEFLRVNDLTLKRGKQRIAIDGSSAAALSLYLDSISVADIFTILPAMGYTADGTIHGQAQVENMFATPAVQADIGVDSFKVNQNTVGNIQLLADRRANGWIALNATVLGNETDLRAEGTVSSNPGNGQP
jgi:translocation and assembly module TamB